VEKESVDSKGGVRRGVSLPVLIIAVVVTAGIVTEGFLLQRRFAAAVPAQSNPAGSPVTGAVSKPSAAPSAAPDDSPGAAASAPAPAPVTLTNEELFRLKAPSVVLLQVLDQSGQITKSVVGSWPGRMEL